MSGVLRPYRGMSAVDRVAERRAAIVSACLDIVLAEGVTAVTAEEACRRAGLTKRYFYESFRDRDAALESILRTFHEELQAEIAVALPDVPRTERPMLVVRLIVTALTRDARVARVFAEAAALDVLRRVRDEAVERYIALLIAEVMPWSKRSAAPGAREVVTRMIVDGTTDTIAAWVAGDLDVDQQTLEGSIVEAGLAIAARF